MVSTDLAFVKTVAADPRFVGQLDPTSRQQLETVGALVEVAAFVQALDGNSISLLYLYYASARHSDPSWTMSLVELFSYLADDLVEDVRFQSMLDDGFRSNI